ncbi:5871_t:CDS:2 [Paraglomus brasilianum]|uniref:5871_t:CDS:1 n=1 Tax=Paraglomus brasilianum TaxID=144538 RepID=A0A9N9D4B6_9GLOM|nr:5871_t:CDS:2 [Paraglomus brasilianum]
MSQSSNPRARSNQIVAFAALGLAAIGALAIFILRQTTWTDEGEDERNNDRRRGTRGVARRDQIPRFSNVGSGKRHMSISMKDTILWNPSRDPRKPNYAFIESVLPFLHKISNYYTITLITPVSTPEERVAIISLLRHAGLFEGVIDERRVLFCETEVGKVHIIKHIGASVHVEDSDTALFNMLSFYWILYLASALIWTTAQARPRSSHNIVKREHFEERYINTLNYKLHNETVKLIGYKKIKIPFEEIDAFEDHYFTNNAGLQELDFHFYDPASMELRIYFPVAGALINHKGSMIEANELGEFEINDVDGDYVVLGRKQTDHIHGVHGNIIKDGIIYLADKAHPTHQIGKVFVYDFGYRSLYHHHDHSRYKRSDGKTGCIANHGGVNCSNKFNIHSNRCPENPNTCMDYNGYFTDCKKEHNNKYKYFLGSDCSISLARGHCWNEIMD